MSNKQIELLIELSFSKTEPPINVGRLAVKNGKIYFEYDAEFIERGLNISPINLPTKEGLQVLPPEPFAGLAGVFADSLPDGWGQLLLDRNIRANGGNPAELSPLDRLAYIGHGGVGALCYTPDNSIALSADTEIELDNFASEIAAVLNDEADDALDKLLRANGGSAGARPKIMIATDANKKNIIAARPDTPDEFETWLIKFPNLSDGSDAGAIEYVYALIAEQAGVEMSATHLFSTASGAGYFGTKRFDRAAAGGRLHMHSAAGLLHADFRTPALDYGDLLTLTHHLTQNIKDVERMFRLAVFNILSHNRDDHSKNFSFLMDAQGEWRFAPAYDITFSHGINGEQSTLLLGDGLRNANAKETIEKLQTLGERAKINPETISDAIDRTRAALNQWQTLAKQYNVSAKNISEINKHLLI